MKLQVLGLCGLSTIGLLLANGAAAQTEDNSIFLGGSVAIVSNDAGSGSSLGAAAIFNGFVDFRMNPNIYLQAGLSQSTDADDAGSDNTGEWALSVSSSDVYGGVKFVSNPIKRVRFYGEAGVLYYYSQIEFKESFYGLKPAGKIEEVEEGTGYYLGGGAQIKLNSVLNLEAGVTYRNRQDYFEESNDSFDLESIGVVGAVVFEL